MAVRVLLSLKARLVLALVKFRELRLVDFHLKRSVLLVGAFKLLRVHFVIHFIGVQVDGLILFYVLDRLGVITIRCQFFLYGCATFKLGSIFSGLNVGLVNEDVFRNYLHVVFFVVL